MQRRAIVKFLSTSGDERTKMSAARAAIVASGVRGAGSPYDWDPPRGCSTEPVSSIGWASSMTSEVAEAAEVAVPVGGGERAAVAAGRWRRRKRRLRGGVPPREASGREQ